jgi:hypothetical protein
MFHDPGGELLQLRQLALLGLLLQLASYVRQILK